MDTRTEKTKQKQNNNNQKTEHLLRVFSLHARSKPPSGKQGLDPGHDSVPLWPTARQDLCGALLLKDACRLHPHRHLLFTLLHRQLTPNLVLLPRWGLNVLSPLPSRHPEGEGRLR